MHNRYIFISFSAFSKSKLFWFLILIHTKSHIEKIHSVDAELAGHARKLDVKLQSLCGSSFSLFAVRMLAKPYHLGANWPTTHCEIKDGVHCFTLNFECHNRYNKLFCRSWNSENSDIARWSKNNTEWGFAVFFEKRTKSCFFQKTKKNVFVYKKKQNRWVVFFFLKTGFSQPCSYDSASLAANTSTTIELHRTPCSIA